LTEGIKQTLAIAKGPLAAELVKTLKQAPGETAAIAPEATTIGATQAPEEVAALGKVAEIIPAPSTPTAPTKEKPAVQLTFPVAGTIVKEGIKIGAGKTAAIVPTKEEELFVSETVGGQEAALEAQQRMQGPPTIVGAGEATRKPEVAKTAAFTSGYPQLLEEPAPITGERPSEKPAVFSESIRPETTAQPTEVKTETKRPSVGPGTTVPQPASALFGFTQTGTVEKTATPKAPEVRATIVQIVEQTIQAVTLMRTKDETTISVTIKYPPIFEGATLKIVESSTAKHEFNITFDNLTPEARRLIETQANQVRLQQSLLERGYTLRNIVIAPEVKFGPTAPAALPTSSGEGQGEAERRGFKGFGEKETSAGQSRQRVADADPDHHGSKRGVGGGVQRPNGSLGDSVERRRGRPGVLILLRRPPKGAIAAGE
jgi:hypothetical protein